MRKLCTILLFLPLALLFSPLHAQTVDTAIVGTITDNSGAVIPGATVTVTSVATGIEKKADTNESGEYGVTYLAPGNYDVTVSANGFTSSVQKGIVLQISQQARVNVALKAGGTEQTVVVSSADPAPAAERELLSWCGRGDGERSKSSAEWPQV